MSNAIEEYLQARFAYEELKRAIEIIADDIVLVGNNLKRDPARFSFADTGIELPKESFSGQAYPSSDWPKPETIQDLLRKFHENRLILRKTWHSIPFNLKAGLQPPPPGVLPPQRFDKTD